MIKTLLSVSKLYVFFRDRRELSQNKKLKKKKQKKLWAAMFTPMKKTM